MFRSQYGLFFNKIIQKKKLWELMRLQNRERVRERKQARERSGMVAEVWEKWSRRNVQG